MEQAPAGNTKPHTARSKLIYGRAGYVYSKAIALVARNVSVAVMVSDKSETLRIAPAMAQSKH